MIDDSLLVNSLLEEGFLDQAAVDQGIAKTEQTGEPLYEALINHQLIGEDDLVEVVSRLLNLPAHDVEPSEIPDEVRALVPGSMARRNRVLPLALSDGELVLGMVDPIDVLAMDEIATHTGIDIRPVLVGPKTIADALANIYGDDSDTDLTDDVLASFDDFDVEGMMDEVMAGDEWSDFFPEEDDEPSVEESAVLSREMRDRPSTDVLAEEDLNSEEIPEKDLPELEIIEDLDRPIDVDRKPSVVSNLDDWEVDAAISDHSEEAGDAEILTAANAEELFAEPASGTARLEMSPEGEEESSAAAEELEASLDDTQASHTTVGVGVDHIEEGALGGESHPSTEDSDRLDSTGRTAMGVGPFADADAEDEEEKAQREDEEDAKDRSSASADKKRKEKKTSATGGKTKRQHENTDYGALGRAILKSKPDDEQDDDDLSDAEDDVEEDDDENADAVDADPTVDSPPPETDIIPPLVTEDGQFSRNGSGGDALTRPRLSTPGVTLPEGIDSQGLALALANLLVSKGILTTTEIFELASKLSSSDPASRDD